LLHFFGYSSAGVQRATRLITITLTAAAVTRVSTKINILDLLDHVFEFVGDDFHQSSGIAEDDVSASDRSALTDNPRRYRWSPAR
jgi:hypothetical protein